MKFSHWIEAMRLRTLPVSCSGVCAACALALYNGCLKLTPAIICLAFAILAQIASNFANEYYDYRDGLDRPGRVGPRRCVTEGDITPRAMLIATGLAVIAACALGLTLLLYGPWWLILVGIAVVIGLYAYSAGPYPLSRHALGEAAVVVFFGIIPVNFTYYIMAGQFDMTVAMMSLTIGIMSANILIINNYRDIDDDRSVGKHTIATRFGSTFASSLYLINGFLSIIISSPLFIASYPIGLIPPAIYLILHILIWSAMVRRTGRDLNPLLGITAINMQIFSLLLFAI